MACQALVGGLVIYYMYFRWYVRGCVAGLGAAAAQRVMGWLDAGAWPVGWPGATGPGLHLLQKGVGRR